jgi:hypothetical protein
MFKICEGVVCEGVSQAAPIGRHNAHHAFDFTTLSISAVPTNPYTVAAAMASALLGLYPRSLSMACPQ